MSYQHQQVFNRPLLAYDLSTDSNKMLEIYKQLKNSLDTITIVHVHNPMRNYIPPDYLGQNIQKLLIKQFDKQPNLKICVKAIQNNKSINQIILETYLNQKSNILFMGFTGNKGRKVRNQQLSSRVRQFVYDSKLTLAIIKCSPKYTKKALFCCDGSQISLEGLKNALSFCRMHNIELSIFHASNPDLQKYSKQVKIHLKSTLLKLKSLQSPIIIQQTNLLNYLLKQNQKYQWIIITRNGYRGQISQKYYIGTKTTQILINVQCNILLLS